MNKHLQRFLFGIMYMLFLSLLVGFIFSLIFFPTYWNISLLILLVSYMIGFVILEPPVQGKG